MPRNLSRAWIAGALATLAACGTARILQETPYAGVIELQGDHNKAMEQANEHMAVHCGPANFIVMSAGYEAIAERPSATAGPSAPTAPTPPSEPQTSAMVWLVRYQCGSGLPTGTMAPPQPGS